MKALNKLWEGLMKFVEAVIVIQLSLLSLVLVYQVIMRYVFNNPPVWSEELALFLMQWITFIGVSYGIHKRLHVRMPALELRLPPTWRKALVISSNILCLTACFLAIRPAWAYFSRMAVVTSPAMRLPYGFVYICLPIGYTLVVMSFIVDIIRVCKGDLPRI